MDRDSKIFLSTLLPALLHPQPKVSNYFALIIKVLLWVRPPPKHALTLNYRLFGSDENYYSGRNVFQMLATHRYQFFELCGETPETLLRLLNTLDIISQRPRTLSTRNRVLLTLIWLRSYPTFMMLSSLFDISVSTVKDEIRALLPCFYLKLKRYIKWPSVQEWSEMMYVWNKIPMAVGAIDGTSHRIHRPKVEPQEQYYSGHRQYHAIHTQIIVDNSGVIRYIETGFLGHQNDAQQIRMMRQVGTDLEFPGNSVLLADKIYPNGYPLMTPYTSAQLYRMHMRIKRKSRKLNRYITKYRVVAEHSIAELKTYKSVGGVWRNKRNVLPRVVHICGGLVCRRKEEGLTT